MSVGESLARARQDRGLSIEDVAADTRIRSALIRAIEADDFGPCGGAVYARGHIRSIARVVGVDPAPLIAEFDAANDVAPQQAAVAAQPTDRDVVARSDRRRPQWAAAMVAAVVIVIVLAAVGLLHKGSGNGGTATNTAGTHGTTTPSTPPTTSPTASSKATIPASRTQQASMLVRTTHGETWLEVKSVSGTTLFSGLLENGRSKRFTDKHGLVFTIGNAPAVDVVVNGHDIGSPHTANVVLRGQVTPGVKTVRQT